MVGTTDDQIADDGYDNCGGDGIHMKHVDILQKNIYCVHETRLSRQQYVV